MQSPFLESQPIEVSEALFDSGANLMESDGLEAEATAVLAPMCFHSQFIDCMEMYADVPTVAQYLGCHQDWFTRCAAPMKVDAIAENGYALTIGRFGSFGYEVEPKVGLELLPPDEGIYRIRTIPVPNYTPPGYDVDFRATMQLVAGTAEDLNLHQVAAVTRVEWQLDLAVYIAFPKFIYKLPHSLLQKTGDRILCQIVRQVSRRLTYKVQQDFHSKLGIPFRK